MRYHDPMMSWLLASKGFADTVTGVKQYNAQMQQYADKMAMLRHTVAEEQEKKTLELMKNASEVGADMSGLAELPTPERLTELRKNRMPKAYQTKAEQQKNELITRFVGKILDDPEYTKEMFPSVPLDAKSIRETLQGKSIAEIMAGEQEYKQGLPEYAMKKGKTAEGYKSKVNIVNPQDGMRAAGALESLKSEVAEDVRRGYLSKEAGDGINAYISNKARQMVFDPNLPNSVRESLGMLQGVLKPEPSYQPGSYMSLERNRTTGEVTNRTYRPAEERKKSKREEELEVFKNAFTPPAPQGTGKMLPPAKTGVIKDKYGRPYTREELERIKRGEKVSR
jgi:hypothetical protein